MRPGSFPSIVHPEPIFRCTPDLLFDNLIYFGCERCGGSICRIKALDEHHAPSSKIVGVNAGSNERSPSTVGEQSSQRRSGSQPSKKRCPHSVVTGMLVAQHTHTATAAE